MPARAIAPEPASPAQIPSSRRTDQLPLAVLGLGLLITTGIVLQNILFNRRYHEQAERALLDDVADALVARMGALSASVAGISAMAEANGSHSPESIRRYVDTLSNAGQLPQGSLGLGYARFVLQSDKASFEAKLTASYGQAVQIRPAGARASYAPVAVMQPMDQRNSRAIGFDLLSEPIRRQALIEAALTGNPVLTARLELEQNALGDNEPGAILYMRIRRDLQTLLPSQANPFRDVWGWASCPIRIEEVMQATLQTINNPNLQGSRVLLFDGPRPSRFGLLYDPTESFGTPRLSDPNYQRIMVGGRSWLVGVELTRALPGPDGLHWSQAVIFLVGSLISALAAMVSRELLLSHRRTVDALHQVSEVAEDLAISAAVFEGTVQGVVITSPEGLVLSLNRSFTQLTGYTNMELHGKSLRILRSGNHDDSFYAQLWQELLQEGRWHRELWNRCKDGRVRLHDVSITTVTDKQLRPLHYVAMYQDITARYTEQQSILHQATHDALTGLANRTLLVDRLAQALAMAQRYGYMVALMFMDLDGFKAMNDTYGHSVGDQLLIAVSRRLEAIVRKTDTICRQGGDEFILMLPQAPDLETLMALAERIQAELRLPFTGLHATEVLHISVSVGIARWPEHGSDIDGLMLAADRAMYLSKKSADKHPVVAGSPTTDSAAAEPPSALTPADALSGAGPRDLG
jgi:diguanylate cyclase (GGDEF)-like protein/PAS domain S-box-containing protein